KTQAADIRAVVTALGYDRTSVVSHDIGIMVAYAYAARYPGKVERLVVLGAPLPGVGPWDDIVRHPALWHFSVRGPDAERLVRGRERIYLDRIWNAFTGDPGKPDQATRAYYAAQYARPGAMRAGFAQFAAFSQDAEDNRVFQRAKLTMPVLAIGGEKSFGAIQAVVMRSVATDVREAVVPGAGHWLMEERPAATVALIEGFLMDQTPPGSAAVCPVDERRVTPNEFKFSEGGGPGTGTSGVSGIRTVVLKGDPDRGGLVSRLRGGVRRCRAEGAPAWELLYRAGQPHTFRRDSRGTRDHPDHRDWTLVNLVCRSGDRSAPRSAMMLRHRRSASSFGATTGRLPRTRSRSREPSASW